MRRVCLKVTHGEGISAGFSGRGSPDQLEEEVSGKGSSGQRLGFPGCWFGSEEEFPAGLQHLAVFDLIRVSCGCHSFSSSGTETPHSPNMQQGEAFLRCHSVPSWQGVGQDGADPWDPLHPWGL